MDSCRQVDLDSISPLVTGSPLQPPLEQLLQFAEDTITFGAQLSAQIDTSLSVLTFKGLNTNSLVENFRIFSNWQQRIPEIIAYTSFCSENKI